MARRGARVNPNILLAGTNQFSTASPFAAGVSGIADIFNAFKQRKEQERLQPFIDAQRDAQLAQNKLAAQQAQLEFVRNNAVSLGNFADDILPDLKKARETGDFSKVIEMAENRDRQLTAQGSKDKSHTQYVINALKSGDEAALIDVEQSLGILQQTKNNIIQRENQAKAGQIKQKAGQLAGSRTFLDPTSNEVVEVANVFNPNTNTFNEVETSRTPKDQVINPRTGLTAGEAQEKKEKDEERELSTFQKKEQIKARAARRKEIKTELSDRNRLSSRSQVKVREALQLASNRDTAGGLMADAKLKLARVFPNIDVTNEAALDSLLTGLAIDQLQNFKGPTTDFEFGKTESIGGTIRDPKIANIARLNSLSRANWFNDRELKQYNKFIKDGGDPDNFRFNFNEEIKTQKGTYTLRDIQDTAAANNMTIEEVLSKLGAK